MPDYDLIPLGRIDPAANNPRKRFDETKLAELAASIVSHGLIEPIVVRPTADDRYEIVCGERRFRATKIAGSPLIRAVIRELTDAGAREIRLIENVQREDLHPMEEAQAMQESLDAGDYGEGVEAKKALAAKLGKSTRYVYNRLKLADLIEPAKELLLDGVLDASKATLICPLTPVQQQSCLDALDESPFSTRELADWIREFLFHELEFASFDIADENLLPVAGSCLACPKRLSVQAIDAGDPMPERDACLDVECFEAKEDALRDKTRREKDAAKAARKADVEKNQPPKPERSFVPAPDGGAPVVTPRPNVSHEPVKMAAAPSVAHEPVEDPESRKRAERKDEIRTHKTQRIFRKAVFDQVLAAVDSAWALHQMGIHMSELFAICAVKLSLHTSSHTDFQSDSPAHLQHPGRSAMFELLGIKGRSGYGIRDKDLGKTAAGLSKEVGAKALFMALTADELHHQDSVAGYLSATPEPFALMAYAGWLDIDTTKLLADAEFATLSKKEQLARSAKTQAKQKAPAEPPRAFEKAAPDQVPAKLPSGKLIAFTAIGKGSDGAIHVSAEDLQKICYTNSASALANEPPKGRLSELHVMLTALGGYAVCLMDSGHDATIFEAESAATCKGGTVSTQEGTPERGYCGRRFMFGGGEYVLTGKSLRVTTAPVPKVEEAAKPEASGENEPSDLEDRLDATFEAVDETSSAPVTCECGWSGEISDVVESPALGDWFCPACGEPMPQVKTKVEAVAEEGAQALLESLADKAGEYPIVEHHEESAPVSASRVRLIEAMVDGSAAMVDGKVLMQLRKISVERSLLGTEKRPNGAAMLVQIAGQEELYVVSKDGIQFADITRIIPLADWQEPTRYRPENGSLKGVVFRHSGSQFVATGEKLKVSARVAATVK